MVKLRFKALKSKKELIEKFIESNLKNIPDKSMVEDEFENFMNLTGGDPVDDAGGNDMFTLVSGSIGVLDGAGGDDRC